MYVNLNDYKNISLIGFMGSGKTTVGKILAEKLISCLLILIG